MARNPSGFFITCGNLLHPLELVPDSRKYVVPTEWQVRTVLGDSISKAEVISIQAPQYRQCALISDFLNVAKLSIGEEAALAMNWIKDRPEGLTLQNLALATMTGSSGEQFTEKYDCRCSIRHLTNANLWPQGNQLSLHGNPSAMCSGLAHRTCGSPSRSVIAEYAIPVLYDSPRHPRRQYRHPFRPAVNPLLECSSGKTVQDQLANFFSTAFDPRAWTMVVFWEEDSRTSAPADYT